MVATTVTAMAMEMGTATATEMAMGTVTRTDSVSASGSNLRSGVRLRMNPVFICNSPYAV